MTSKRKAKDMQIVNSEWDDFVGQKESISILKKMDAAGKRTHVLLHGPPGIGKTTIARILAHDSLIAVLGSSLNNPDKLATMILAAVEQKINTFFIDEVHSAKLKALEVLYPVMEEGMLYIGEVVPAPIYIVAATTDGGRLPKPFVDRFGIEVRLRLYNESEMGKIVKEISREHNVKLSSEIVEDVARRSLGIPRTARKIVERLSDFGKQYYNDAKYTEIIELTGIDPDGLTATERVALKVIWDSFSGGPVGVKTIANATGLDERLLTQYVEPVLIRLGYLVIEHSGRKLTSKGVARAVTI